jgi:hypothetical protein
MADDPLAGAQWTHTQSPSELRLGWLEALAGKLMDEKQFKLARCVRWAAGYAERFQTIDLDVAASAIAAVPVMDHKQSVAFGRSSDGGLWIVLCQENGELQVWPANSLGATTPGTCAWASERPLAHGAARELQIRHNHFLTAIENVCGSATAAKIYEETLAIVSEEALRAKAQG